MGATDAERQRRRRLHVKGDHSLCDQGRCGGAASVPAAVTAVTRPTVTPRTTVTEPQRLGDRGRRLWRELAAGRPGPAELVLIEEACRLVDRLERLDEVLSDGADQAWLELRLPEDGSVAAVVVDKALSEARQQQLALKQLLSELRQASGKTAGGPQEASAFDQLAARRKARLAEAAGS